MAAEWKGNQQVPFFCFWRGKNELMEKCSFLYFILFIMNNYYELYRNKAYYWISSVIKAGLFWWFRMNQVNERTWRLLNEYFPSIIKRQSAIFLTIFVFLVVCNEENKNDNKTRVRKKEKRTIFKFKLKLTSIYRKCLPRSFGQRKTIQSIWIRNFSFLSFIVIDTQKMFSSQYFLILAQ